MTSINPKNIGNQLLQARLHQLLFNLHEAVLVEDEHRKIALANPIFCQMFANGAPPKALIGADCSNAAAEAKGLFKDPDGFVNRVEELLANRDLVIGDELELVNGVFLERDYIPIYLSENEYKGHLWKYRDITQQKNNELAKKSLINELNENNAALLVLNEELNSTNEMLSSTLDKLQRTQAQLAGAQKMAALGTLAAGLAHEINNPANYISGGIQVAKSIVTDFVELINAYQEADSVLKAYAPKQYEQIQSLKKEINPTDLNHTFSDIEHDVLQGIKRITTISNSLRKFSKKEVLLEKSLCRLDKVIEDALALAPLPKHIQLEKNYDFSLAINCECILIAQAFAHLIQNAQEAIGEKEGLIKISAQSSGEWLWVEVEDNGKGISPKNLPSIFDPFFTTKDVGEGMGMGLYTAYQIIEAHGGTIEVDSTENQSSVFRLSLPIE